MAVEVVDIDIEAVTVAFMTAEFGDGVRCLTELPANLEAEVPVLQVARIGGPKIGRLDRAIIDLDAYDTGRIAARLIALQAIAVISEFANSKVDGGVITRVDLVNGPANRPYANPGIHRVGATCQITALSHS